MLDVIAVAVGAPFFHCKSLVSNLAQQNELLMDRLSLICSAVILRHVNLSNSTSLLVDATHFNALPLVQRIREYIAKNMETFLESSLLDTLPTDIVKQLAAFIRSQQALKAPLTRSNRLVQSAMEKNADWLSHNDFPEPLIPGIRVLAPRDSNPKLSPPGPMRTQKSSSPVLRPRVTSSRPNVPVITAGEDEVFSMDETDVVPRLNLNATQQSPGYEREKKDIDDSGAPKVAPGWKVSTAPRCVMC